MTFTPQVRLFVHSVFFYEETGPGWSPTDPECFTATGMVFAGSEAEGPGDAFDVTVCTPRWVAEQLERPAKDGPRYWWLADGQVLLGRGLILIQRWDRAAIERAVAEVFQRAEGPTWQLAADRAGRMIPWEFAYRHDEELDRFVSERNRPST